MVIQPFTIRLTAFGLAIVMLAGSLLAGAGGARCLASESAAVTADSISLNGSHPTCCCKASAGRIAPIAECGHCGDKSAGRESFGLSTHPVEQQGFDGAAEWVCQCGTVPGPTAPIPEDRTSAERHLLTLALNATDAPDERPRGLNSCRVEPSDLRRFAFRSLQVLCCIWLT